jgi:hypothetical protein
MMEEKSKNIHVVYNKLSLSQWLFLVKDFLSFCGVTAEDLEAVNFGDTGVPFENKEYEVFICDSKGRAMKLENPDLKKNQTISFIEIGGEKIRVFFILFKSEGKAYLVINDPQLQLKDTSLYVPDNTKGAEILDFLRKKQR